MRMEYLWKGRQGEGEEGAMGQHLLKHSAGTGRVLSGLERHPVAGRIPGQGTYKK